MSSSFLLAMLLLSPLSTLGGGTSCYVCLSCPADFNGTTETALVERRTCPIGCLVARGAVSYADGRFPGGRRGRSVVLEGVHRFCMPQCFSPRPITPSSAACMRFDLELRPRDLGLLTTDAEAGGIDLASLRLEVAACACNATWCNGPGAEEAVDRYCNGAMASAAKSPPLLVLVSVLVMRLISTYICTVCSCFDLLLGGLQCVKVS